MRSWLAPLCLLWSLTLPGCHRSGNNSQEVLRIATGDSGEGLIPHRRVLAELASQEGDLRFQLEPVSGGDYYTRLLTELASSTPPDILQLGDDAVGTFASRGCLSELPMPPRSLYFPALLAPGMCRERLYVLPKDYTTLAVYCNLKLFREAGVALPGPDWDLDTFVAVARKLSVGGRSGVVLPAVRSACLEWLTLLHGGRLYDPQTGTYQGAMDGPASLTAMKFLQSLYREGLSPWPSELGSFTGGLIDFEEGRAAMKIGGHWPLAGLRKDPRIELAVLPLPGLRGRRVNLLHWAGLGVARGSRQQARALKVLQAYCGPAGSRAFAGWALPPLRQVAETSGLQADPLERVWLDELNYVQPRSYVSDPLWMQVGAPATARLHEAIVVDRDLDVAGWAHRVAREADQLRQQRLRELP